MGIKRYEFLYYKVHPVELVVILKKLLNIKRIKTHYKDLVFDIDPVSYHGLSLLKKNNYEEEMTNEICRILEAGDTFIDLGANEGFFSVIGSKKVGPKGKVLVIEPQKRCLNVILSNIEINALVNCTILPFGISDREGSSEIILFPTTNSGASTMSGKFNFEMKFSFLRKMFLKKQKLQLCTLDSLLAGYETVKLIKIDIEGFELLALKGAAKGLKEGKIKNFLVEVHPVALHAMNVSVADVINHMTGFGYSDKKIAENLHLFTKD